MPVPSPTEPVYRPLRLISALALRTTQVCKQHRYLGVSLLEPKEVANPAEADHPAASSPPAYTQIRDLTTKMLGVA